MRHSLTTSPVRRAAAAIAVGLSAAVLAACAPATGVPPTDPTDPAATSTRFLLDREGRVVILRGSNADNGVAYNERRLPDITRDDARNMAEDLGFSGVRLLLLWEAIEPEQGRYDLTYLDAIRERLDWFAEHDIHVLLDLHQDCPFVDPATRGPDNGYRGVPAWAFAIGSEGWPFTRAPGGAYEECLKAAPQRYVRNFFDPSLGHPELQDHYLAAVRLVAERLADHPAVIGIDVMNEPTPPVEDTVVNGLTSLAGVPNRLLTRFMQRAVNVIREVDSDTYVIVEPTAQLVNNGLATDLGRLNDPRPGVPRIVVGPHAYDPFMIAGVDAGLAWKNAFADQWWARRDAEWARWPTPMLVGEWGDYQSEEAVAYWADRADRRMVGWFNWGYSRGWADSPESARYVRPYPRAIAGVPVSFRWDRAADRFLFEFLADPAVTAPTELVLPRLVFPDGFEVTIDGQPVTPGSDGLTWDATASVLSLDGLESGRHQVEVRAR